MASIKIVNHLQSTRAMVGILQRPCRKRLRLEEMCHHLTFPLTAYVLHRDNA